MHFTLGGSLSEGCKQWLSYALTFAATRSNSVIIFSNCCRSQMMIELKKKVVVAYSVLGTLA